jgi:hypothetical protein
MKKLKQIFKKNNKIKSIQSNAFNTLKDLTDINIENNPIKFLNEDILNFTAPYINIYLNKNRLNLSLMNNNTFKTSNGMIHLPQIVFMPFFNGKNIIFLLDNNFICNCDDVFWILNETKLNLAKHIIHMQCYHFSREIFRHKEELMF